MNNMYCIACKYDIKLQYCIDAFIRLRLTNTETKTTKINTMKLDIGKINNKELLNMSIVVVLVYNAHLFIYTLPYFLWHRIYPGFQKPKIYKWKKAAKIN